MRNNCFRYTDTEARVLGFVDENGTYYLTDGHHRINAALELWWETGDRSFLERLIDAGDWERRKPERS